MGRNGIRKRTNCLTDNQDEEALTKCKKTNAKEVLSTQLAEEYVYHPGSVDTKTINYYYGGYFTSSPSRKYVSGKLKKSSDIDVDFIGFFDIVGDLNEHCKFNIMEDDKFYYLRGDRAITDYDGLVECRDDSDVQRMLDSYKMHKNKPIEIYTLSRDYDIMGTSFGKNSFRNSVSEEVNEVAVGEQESSDGLETNSTGSNVVKRKTRGPTRCLEIINLEEGKKLLVKFNDDHKPIGKNSTKFTWFLGHTIRSRRCPLKVSGWREIEPAKIDHMWEIILDKFTFNVSEGRKSAIIGHMSDLYRNYRHKLKKKYFDSKTTYQLRLRNKPKSVPVDDWKYLVNLWSGAEFQKRSMQNKTNRSKRSLPPYIGTKSYARFREEMEENDGKAPSRVEVYVESRKRKKGKQVDAFQEDVIAQFEQLKKQQEKGEISLNDDEIFEKVLGAEKNGYVRAYGPGKSVTEYFGGRPTKRELLKKVEAAQKEASERIEEVKKEALKQVEEIKRESLEQVEEMKKDMNNKFEEKLVEQNKRWKGIIKKLFAAKGQDCSDDAFLDLMDEL